jgi:hypothetical protein
LPASLAARYRKTNIIDGVDQRDLSRGKKERSNRESVVV